MRSFKFIIVLGGILGCVVTSYSQSLEMSPIKRLEDQFNANELAPIQLQSFDKRAQQKLYDLAGYLSIMHHTDYSTELKQQVQMMLKALFLDESHIPKISTTHPQITIQQLRSSRTFERINDLYRKEIMFHWTETLPQGKSIVREMKAEIILKQVKQQFGQQEEVVWKVFLGKISVYHE